MHTLEKRGKNVLVAMDTIVLYAGTSLLVLILMGILLLCVTIMIDGSGGNRTARVECKLM